MMKIIKKTFLLCIAFAMHIHATSIRDFVKPGQKLPLKEKHGLTTLDLSHKGITSLEGLTTLINERTDFDKIESLDLSHNKIDDISVGGLVALNSLPHLQRLKLDHNRLKEIYPNIFSKLSLLRSLYLNNNLLEKISPQAFNGLVKLKRLYLYNNKLETIPLNLFNWIKLRTHTPVKVYLKSNKLTVQEKQKIKNKMPKNVQLIFN